MVVIGLENVLVLTKSVVSTPVDLEVKLRIAQGNTVGELGRGLQEGLERGLFLLLLTLCEQTAPEMSLALASSIICSGPLGPGSS